MLVDHNAKMIVCPSVFKIDETHCWSSTNFYLNEKFAIGTLVRGSQKMISRTSSSN